MLLNNRSLDTYEYWSSSAKEIAVTELYMYVYSIVWNDDDIHL